MSPAAQAYRRPESVLVIVYTDDAQILLLKRVTPFAFWQSVTGSLLEAESQAAAAAREFREETGIIAGDNLSYTNRSRPFTIDPRWQNRFAPGTVENLEHEWRLRIARPVNIVLDPAEHSDYQWIAIDSAIDAVWSWTNKEALEQLREEL